LSRDSFGPSARAYRSPIAAAGAVAAAVFHHGPRPTLRQVEAQLEGSDREELRLESLSSLQPLSTPLTEVLPAVLRCWSAVSGLAKDLYLGREISHADVCAALGLTDGGGSGSVGLAMVEVAARRAANTGIATATWRKRWASRGISHGPRRCHDGCCSFGCRDVFVDRYRGVDPSVGS
jgi:hypothetical protein